MSRRLKAIGTAVVLAACVVQSVGLRALFANGRPLKVATSATTRPDSGSFQPALDQPMHDYGIMGLVTRPAVYALPRGTLKLSELVRIAGGVTGEGAINARIVRSGRMQATVVMPGTDAELYPGDIAILDSPTAAANPETAPTTADVVTTVGYLTDATPAQDSKPKNRFVQLTYIGLYDHPVIAKVPANEATLTNIVYSLNQSPEAIHSIKVVPAGTQRRAGNQQQAGDVQLASGTILIFDRAGLAIERLPTNVPSPISCSATGIPIEQAGTPNGSTEAAQSELHIPPAPAAADAIVPPAPIDNESLDLTPPATAPQIEQSPGIQPQPMSVPNSILEEAGPQREVIQNLPPDVHAPQEVHVPRANEPTAPRSSNATDELPQWTGKEPVAQPAEQPAMTSPASPSEGGHPLPTDRHPDHRDGHKHNAPEIEGVNSAVETAPPVPRDGDFLDSSSEFPTIHGAGSTPQGNTLPEMPFDPLPPDPMSDAAPKATHSEEKAASTTLVDPSEPGTMDAPKAKSVVRISLPGIKSFVIPTDLFVVSVLGILAAVIALSTLIPAGKGTKVLTEMAEVIIPGVAEVAASVAGTDAETTASKPEAETDAPAEAPTKTEATSTTSEATPESSEDTLEALIQNKLPIVEEPYQIRSGLTFFGRSTVRIQHRIDTPHERTTPHVAPRTGERDSQPLVPTSNDDQIVSVSRQANSNKKDREKQLRTASHADLLDRALSNIQGAQIR